MLKALVLTPAPERCRHIFDDIHDADIEFVDRTSVSDEKLQEADVLLGNIPKERLTDLSGLKWLQLDSAGSDNYADINDQIKLTNASGCYGEAISEYMIAEILSVMKKIPQYLDMQKKHDSIDLGQIRMISGSTAVSIGMGDIGSTFAKKMNALGATVYGVRRNIHETPDYIKKMYTPDTMDEILPLSDITALSLPQTSKTKAMFNYDRMKKLKEGSILINVGRGSAIVTDDLVKIMEEGWLSAVILDVTAPEPLPRNHVLWNMENVYLTPHISGRFNAPVTVDKIFYLFHENLVRFLNDEPLINLVNRETGYRTNR